MEFEDDRDADDAFYEMNYQSLYGRRITYEHFKEIFWWKNFYRGDEKYKGRRVVYSGGKRDDTVMTEAA